LLLRFPCAALERVVGGGKPLLIRSGIRDGCSRVGLTFLERVTSSGVSSKSLSDDRVRVGLPAVLRRTWERNALSRLIAPRLDRHDPGGGHHADP
jgi:hypothetical protein